MNKSLIFISILLLAINSNSQEFDRETILKNKIKEVRLTVKVDSAFTDSSIIHEYNAQGFLIKENPTLVPFIRLIL